MNYKLRRMMKMLCAALLAGYCGSCARESGTEWVEFTAAGIASNTHIGDLTSLYTGSPLLVDDSVVVGGFVTTTDITGNFYRSFIIEDETGAVEVMAGLYDLHATYHYGQRVLVRCGGLTLGAAVGVPQLGAAGSGSYQAGYLAQHLIVAGRYLVRDNLFVHPVPREVRIGELESSLCGRLVTVRDVQLDANQGDTWALTGAMTGGTSQTAYRQFKDIAGDSINVVTSGYASFAASPLPAGRVSLTGILQYGPRGSGRSVYLLKLRDLGDVD